MWTELSNYHWGWMGVGAIHMILVWGFFILAITALIRYVFSADRQKPAKLETNPLAALKLRYARGELTKQQYQDLKAELQEE